MSFNKFSRIVVVAALTSSMASFAGGRRSGGGNGKQTPAGAVFADVESHPQAGLGSSPRDSHYKSPSAAGNDWFDISTTSGFKYLEENMGDQSIVQTAMSYSKKLINWLQTEGPIVGIPDSKCPVYDRVCFAVARFDQGAGVLVQSNNFKALGPYSQAAAILHESIRVAADLNNVDISTEKVVELTEKMMSQNLSTSDQKLLNRIYRDPGKSFDSKRLAEIGKFAGVDLSNVNLNSEDLGAKLSEASAALLKAQKAATDLQSKKEIRQMLMYILDATAAYSDLHIDAKTRQYVNTLR